jgi:hypothetical protein
MERAGRHLRRTSMRFMIIVKATKDSEAGVIGKEAEIEVRQLFELEDFGDSGTLERFREIGVGAGR